MGPQKSLHDRLGDHYGDRLLSGCRDPTHSRKLERAAGPKEQLQVVDFWSNFGVFKSVVFGFTSANETECQNVLFNNFGPLFCFSMRFVALEVC